MNLCFIYFTNNEIHLSFLDELLLNKETKTYSLSEENLHLINEEIIQKEAIVLGYNLQDFLAVCFEKFSFTFSFEYFDILRLFRAYYGIEEEPSLEELAYDYEIELEDFNPAKSMFLFLIEDSGNPINDFLFGLYGDCKCTASKAAKYQYYVNKEKQMREEKVNKIVSSPIKGVFVFDFECANSSDGVSKICEMGGLYLDKDLNLIKEEEYLINPESAFRLGPYISLYYSERQYISSPTLPYQYEKFRKYFEDDSILKVGFSSSNDIKFLITDLERYNIAIPSFVCFDVQPLANKALNRDTSISLGEANIALLGDLGDSREHRSLDDAKLTSRLFRYFLGDKNLQEFLKNNIDVFDSSFNFDGIRENYLPKLRYW